MPMKNRLEPYGPRTFLVRCGLKAERTETLIKPHVSAVDAKKYLKGVVSLPKTISFPPHYIGRRVRILIEVIKDD